MLVLNYSIKAAKKSISGDQNFASQIKTWTGRLRQEKMSPLISDQVGMFPTSFDICKNCEPKQSSSLDHDISTCLTESHSTGCWARNLLLHDFFSRACCTPAVPSFHMIGHPMETSQLTREMSVVFQRTHLHMQTHVTAVTLASCCYHTLYHIHYVYRICAHVLARYVIVEWHT